MDGQCVADNKINKGTKEYWRAFYCHSIPL